MLCVRRCSLLAGQHTQHQICCLTEGEGKITSNITHLVLGQICVGVVHAPASLLDVLLALVTAVHACASKCLDERGMESVTVQQDPLVVLLRLQVLF